ncbi:m-AAA protease-interacting protein 1, mitochondrial isoform 2-T2 [Aulostomus maculatus]
MRRLSSLVACRELAGLVASKRALSCGRKPAVHRQTLEGCVRPERPFRRGLGEHGRVHFAGQNRRLFSSQSGGEGHPESSGRQPAVSVVGIPDFITWIRCKVILLFIELFFRQDVTSEEFERGVKQAVVHISDMMSRGQYAWMRRVVSKEMVKHIEERCKSLTKDQREQLAISVDDIIFVLPEDVSVVFDDYAFWSLLVRFLFLRKRLNTNRKLVHSA